MKSHLTNIHDEISKIYSAIREQNKKKQQRIIAVVYREIPRIKEIDEEISAIGINVAAQVLKGSANPQKAVEQMKSNMKLLTEEKKRLLISANYPADATDEVYTCKVCRDRGYADGRRCFCYIQKRNALLQKYSNIKISANNSFEKFNSALFSPERDAKYGVSPRENIESVQKIALTFAHCEKDSPKNLLFYGATGLGKTYTSDCIAKKYIQHGKTVFYMSAPKMFSIFEDYKFGRDTSPEAAAVISSVGSAELLIIDDLGTEFKNAYSDSILFDIINSRIIEEKRMIISTNLSIKELKHVYSERICSRILGNFNVVLFFGEDLRLKDI